MGRTKHKKNHLRARRFFSFTLLELLIVIGIIAVVMTIGAFSYSRLSAHFRDSKRVSDLDELRTALELYRTNNSGHAYPSQISFNCPPSGTLTDPGTGTVYMQRLPNDPLCGLSSRNYVYNFVNTAGTYELTALLEDNQDYIVGPHGRINRVMLGGSSEQQSDGGPCCNPAVMTWPFNVLDHPNRLLVVGILSQTSGNPGTINSVKYANIPLTSYTSSNYVVRVQIWYLVNPPTGTNNIVVTGSSMFTSMRAVASSWYNVNQTTPFGTAVRATGSACCSNYNPVGPYNVTTTPTDTVLDILGGDNIITITQDSSQLLVGNVVANPNNGTSGYSVAMSKKSAFTNTTSMLWHTDDFMHFSYVAVPIKYMQ